MSLVGCTPNGMTADNRIHVRIQTNVKEEMKVAAKLKGLKPSTYIHSLIVEAIREAKRRDPEAFAKARKLPFSNKGKAGKADKGSNDQGNRETG